MIYTGNVCPVEMLIEFQLKTEQTFCSSNTTVVIIISRVIVIIIVICLFSYFQLDLFFIPNVGMHS